MWNKWNTIWGGNKGKKYDQICIPTASQKSHYMLSLEISMVACDMLLFFSSNFNSISSSQVFFSGDPQKWQEFWAGELKEHS